MEIQKVVQSQNNHPVDFNLSEVAQTFNRAAPTYDDVAMLQRKIADNMIARLSLITIDPKRILDVGSGTGYVACQLASRYKNATVIELDIAFDMLRSNGVSRSADLFASICGDTHHLPFADHSFDFIISNLMLPWCGDINAVFKEWQRILKPGGLLMFSTLGQETLKELRLSWREVDQHTHVHLFMDLKDIGNELMAAGFAEPVMDVDNHQLHYASLKRLFLDLKDSGGHNLAFDRLRGLTGKKGWQQMLTAYEQKRTSEHRFPATYQVVYGHAWGSDLLAARSSSIDNEISIPVAEIQRPKHPRSNETQKTVVFSGG